MKISHVHTLLVIAVALIGCESDESHRAQETLGLELSIIAPLDEAEVALDRYADLTFHFAANGLYSADLEKYALLFWVQPARPWAEGGSWFLQMPPANGIEFAENGAWRAIGQLGNVRHPPRRRDIFNIAITLTPIEKANSLLSRGVAEMRSSKPIGVKTVVSENLTVKPWGAQSHTTKLYSYPHLGFEIRFPASWSVHDKSGDLEGNYSVEGRSPETSDAPGAKKQLLPSEEEQQLPDLEFLRRIRVSVTVQEVDKMILRKSLHDSVQNRMRGIIAMGGVAGGNVDIEPLGRTEVATAPAFITKFTERHQVGSEHFSGATVLYDFEHGPRRYVISIRAPEEEFNEHADVFNRAVQSFSFIDDG